MNGYLHTRINVARVYRPRKEGVCIRVCIRREKKSLHGYLRKTTVWILQADLMEKVIVEEESLKDYQKSTKKRKSGNGKPYMESLFNKHQM